MQDANEDFERQWIRQHIADAAFLKLPVGCNMDMAGVVAALT